MAIKKRKPKVYSFSGIKYTLLFVSGPIEQLPDYNQIRSGMFWMRTWVEHINCTA